LRTLKKIKKLFTNHPNEVGETYFEHLLFASKAAKETAKISCIMMTHAVCPFMCKTSAGEKLNELNIKLQKRKEECE